MKICLAAGEWKNFQGILLLILILHSKKKSFKVWFFHSHLHWPLFSWINKMITIEHFFKIIYSSFHFFFYFSCDFTVVSISGVLGLLNYSLIYLSSKWYLSVLKINGCSLLLLERFGPSFIDLCISKRDDGFGLFGNRNACASRCLQIHPFSKSIRWES